MSRSHTIDKTISIPVTLLLAKEREREREATLYEHSFLQLKNNVLVYVTE